MTKDEQIKDLENKISDLHFKVREPFIDPLNPVCTPLDAYIIGIYQNAAQNIYKAGYRKASDMIDEFVDRLKQDEESVKIGNEWKAVVRDVDIERIADEMRQEVEK